MDSRGQNRGNGPPFRGQRGRGRGYRGRGGRGWGRRGGRDTTSSKYSRHSNLGIGARTDMSVATLPPSSAAYYARFKGWIDAELQAEQTEMDERLMTWSLARLTSEGCTLTDVAARPAGYLFGKRVVRLQRLGPEDLPRHQFVQGDMVMLSRRHPLHEKALTGSVMEKTRKSLSIVVDEFLPSMRDGVWRVDQGANTVAHDRMMAALKRLVTTPTPSPSLDIVHPPPPLVHEHSGGAESGAWEHVPYANGPSLGAGSAPTIAAPPPQVARVATALADILLWSGDAEADVGGGGSATHLESAHISAVERLAAHPAPGVDPDRVSLNGAQYQNTEEGRRLTESQLNAIAAAHVRRITLFHGPPGCGKTFTSVELLRRWVMQERARASTSAGPSPWAPRLPVLAVADSNVAADNLLEGVLAIPGMRAVRLGQPVKVRQGLMDATMDAKMMNHPQARLLAEKKQDLDALHARLPTLVGRDRGFGHRDLAVGWKEYRQLEDNMVAQILRDADVVCATCIGAGADAVQNISFPMVLVDEATQATEPSTLVPLTKGSECIVLAGDHCQLPPTVKDQAASQAGMSMSLFERLITMGVQTSLLDTQFRMHPTISKFPSQHFYQNRLKDGVTSAQRPVPAVGRRVSSVYDFEWPTDSEPVAFVPLDGAGIAEGERQVGKSKFNACEAELVAIVVAQLLNANSQADIGVVSPYLAQVSLIQDQLYRFGIQKGVEVRSVDGYQGREKDIIVFSAVRCNNSGEVGFLADWRRINVAITRARSGLIVIGHADTLSRDPHILAWLQWAKSQRLWARDAVFGPPERSGKKRR